MPYINDADRKALSEADVVAFKVDLSSDEAWDMLRAEGATGPPLLVIYGKNGEKLFTSNAYQISQVVGISTYRLWEELMGCPLRSVISAAVHSGVIFTSTGPIKETGLTIPTFGLRHQAIRAKPGAAQ